MATISKQRFLELLEAAEGARPRALFSGFEVRAAVRGQGDGRQNWVFSGANVETGPNSAVCAEVNAINHMINTAGPRVIVDILVLGPNDNFCTPCGHCRDAINAFSGAHTKVIVANRQGQYRVFTMDEILPDRKGYSGVQPVSSLQARQHLTPIFQAAMLAKGNKYTPYSDPGAAKNLVVYPGVALQMRDGFVAAGAAVETANYKGIGGVASALDKEISKGVYGPIRNIVFVLPDNNFRPISGSDRQWVREFADENTRIHVLTESGLILKTYTMDQFLPHSFGPDNLRP